MVFGGIMKDCENTDKQVDFKSEIQKAQEEILGALFPGLSVSKESLDQIQPRIQNASFLPNEQAPTILDFDIVPNRPLKYYPYASSPFLSPKNRA